VVRRDQAYLDGQSEIYEAEFRLRCKDERYKWILSRGMIVSRGPDGTPLRMIGTHADISLRKEAEENLQLAASVFKHAMEAIVITDPESRIIDVNAAFSRITGYSRAEVLGQNPRLLNSGLQGKDFFQTMWQQLTEHGHWYGEIWNRRKNGEVYAATQNISAVRDALGKVQHYIALSADITVAKSQQQELERIAHYDTLTKLPNRALLADRMNQAMTQTQRRGQQLAVVFLDLDGFKAVNDSHGHDAGDFLLVTVADRMKLALRDGDTLARIGGDEFVAVLLDLTDIASSAPMLNRLLAAASQPVPFGKATLQVSASLGVTYFPQSQDIDADQLMRQADQAMYQAKLAGKNRFHFFDAAQARSVRERHSSRDDIARALLEGEFTLLYQPQVNLRTAQVVGAEALIRWRHPENGLLEPVHFLPLIKDHPLAIELGQWVLEKALQQAERWQLVGLTIPVSINIGARHLQQGDFVAHLRQALAAHPTLRPSCLELELLETSAIGHVDHVAKVIADCREMGVRFALDGFGWGGSSLSYLKRLQIARLKVDRSIVLHMLEDPDELAILQSILGLARAFELELLAEGVETAEQSQKLLQLGCDLAQGFGIAQPMAGADLPDWVRRWPTGSQLRPCTGAR
jgi:diguanylate cyclase (GGDEF)-like protein/PAS domain S-box-containing protein